MISNKKINKFEKIIEYKFKNKNLLVNSLVHPSSLTENKKIIKLKLKMTLKD